MHGDTEEAGFSPRCTPEVPADPVLLTLLSAPSNDFNVVVDGRVNGGLREDASSVFIEGCRYVHSTYNWPECLDFCLHCFHPANLTKVWNYPSFCIFGSGASEIEESASTHCTVLNFTAGSLCWFLSEVVLTAILWNTKLPGKGDGIICSSL